MFKANHRSRRSSQKTNLYFCCRNDLFYASTKTEEERQEIETNLKTVTELKIEEGTALSYIPLTLITGLVTFFSSKLLKLVSKLTSEINCALVSSLNITKMYTLNVLAYYVYFYIITQT